MLSSRDGQSLATRESTRREWLRSGGLGLAASLSMVPDRPILARDGQNNGPFFGRAKSCIFVFLSGGHPQHETFDPKPEAAVELRGPFKPISTNVPGIQFCELLPRIARIADRLCTVRSLATDDNTHGSSAYYYYTGTNKVRGGLPLGKTDRAANRLIDWPSIAAVVGKLRPSLNSPFSSVILPELILNNPGYLFAGQDGGFMGRGWDPQAFECDPSRPGYETDILGLVNEVTSTRLAERRSLLRELGNRFDARQLGPAAATFSRHVRQAFDVLMSGPARAAFDLDREQDSLRDLYGRNKFGQSLLLARRLIESGVRCVQVNWPREPGDLSVGNPVWDTHFDNMGRCRDTLCPPFDLGFSTFIDDLGRRGLLAETLVVVLGDFGRTPKINGNGGRDHWGPVMSGVLAGAGIGTGQVIGASDRNGSLPIDRRIRPEDLSATIFHLLGIDPQTHIEVTGLPFKISTGQVVTGVFGSGPTTDARTAAGGFVAGLPDFNRGPLSNGDFDRGRVIRDRFGEAEFWSARPAWDPDQPTAFGVAGRVSTLVGRDQRGGERYEAQLGFGLADRPATGVIRPGQTVMLAQEIYNQRPGRYTFQVGVAAAADKRTAAAWSRHFRARLVIFRFTDLTRDVGKIAELASTQFEPPFNAGPLELKVSRLLKDQQGGGGELLKGIGVAVVVEKQGSELDLAAAGLEYAVLRVLRARVRFLPRDFKFSDHDRNQDGKLDRGEIPGFLENDFEDLDVDHDGFLVPGELDS
ncbi:MAG: hypothetical protein CMJ65_12610 [Planctomycetaceae bacterium]|nr:hypothetical protein [Planctomycetaceae bacterium]